MSNSMWPHGLQYTRLPFFTVSWSLLRFMSIESVMQFNHLILYHPLLLPSVFPSSRVFSSESVLHIRWPKYWNFSFSLSPSMNIQDWFPLGRTDWISLQSKGLSESSPTPQFKSSNSSVLSFLYSPALTSIHNYWKNHSVGSPEAIPQILTEKCLIW